MPRGLRRGFAAILLLGLRVRIPSVGRGSLSVVSIVCCEVEVSATSWSLVQRGPTDCGASLCDKGEQKSLHPQWTGRRIQTKKEKLIRTEELLDTQLTKSRGFVYTPPCAAMDTNCYSEIIFPFFLNYSWRHTNYFSEIIFPLFFKLLVTTYKLIFRNSFPFFFKLLVATYKLIFRNSFSLYLNYSWRHTNYFSEIIFHFFLNYLWQHTK